VLLLDAEPDRGLAPIIVELLRALGTAIIWGRRQRPDLVTGSG
jgi:hypothetical protein